MPKPVSEHSTTIKARKGDDQAPEFQASQLEPVQGGMVRRVEFEEERRPVFREASVERDWHPRAHDSIDQIHFEVDNLHRLRRDPPRARRPREPPQTRRVFETSGGAVKESQMSTTEGERRVLYTSKRTGAVERDQRFHSGLVDRVIAQRYRDGPTFSEATEEQPRRWLRRKGKSEAREPVREEPAPSEAEFQPQCTAVTHGGVQCRNSAKAGTEYCSSHQDYKPRTLEELLDTQPTRGEDTKPGEGDRAGTGQCAAYTKDGVQCRNGSRQNSKYCSVHKGYRPPSKASLERNLDTKPRHAGARDTKPKVRK